MKNKILAICAITFLGACSGSNNTTKVDSKLSVKNELRIGITQEFENLNRVIGQMVASSYIYYSVNHPLVSINSDWKWQCYLCKELPSFEKGTAKIFKEDGKEKLITYWELKEKATWETEHQ